MCALPLTGGNAASSSRPQVLIAPIEGVIAPVTVELVAHALDQARTANAAVVILRIDTPGGLMDSMRDVIQHIIASPVPVITWVAPGGARAASAGFFLLEAGDLAAMAPGTNCGAAHPVLMGGEMDSIMKEKVENDAAALLRSITSRRGRNSDLAEKAVRESKSFTEKEALDNKLIELIAANQNDLLTQLDGRAITRFNGNQVTLHLRDAEVVAYELSLRQKILTAVSDPNVALVLLVIGALLIYAEFVHPGFYVAGATGAVLLLLGLSALSVLPINWLGAALLVLAFTLFALEAKFASHGVLAVGGAVSMVLGAVMLINSPFPEMRIHWSTAIALAVPFTGITVLLLSLALRSRNAKVETGSEGMIGEIGSALTPLAPEGKVFVHGEYWDAVARLPVSTGARVRVVSIDKLKLMVEPVPDRSGG